MTKKGDPKKVERKYTKLVNRIDTLRYYQSIIEDVFDMVDHYGSVAIAKMHVLKIVQSVGVKAGLPSNEEVDIQLYDALRIGLNDPEYDIS